MFSFALLRKSLPQFALAFLILAVGCSDEEDNPAGNDTDHAEAYGCALVVGTDTLAIADSSAVTGGLEVTAGDTLGPVAVWFLDEHGDWFRPEHDHVVPLDDETHELDVRLTDTNLASVRLGHEISEELEWAFFLDGSQSGATTLRIAILHEGHDDFTSALIPVAINP
ncbi:MAG: hypothetical protein IPG71_12080 [bacterium]|nr:hypothetical protein [bacterium]